MIGMMVKIHPNPLTPIQILCQADGSELARRYKRRAETGERHRGHLDHTLSDKFDLVGLTQLYQSPLDIGGHVLSVDSTDFQEVDYLKLLREVDQLTSGEG